MVVFDFVVLFLKWYFLDREVVDLSWSLIFLCFVTCILYVHTVHRQPIDSVPIRQDFFTVGDIMG